MEKSFPRLTGIQKKKKQQRMPQQIMLYPIRVQQTIEANKKTQKKRSSVLLTMNEMTWNEMGKEKKKKTTVS